MGTEIVSVSGGSRQDQCEELTQWEPWLRLPTSMSSFCLYHSYTSPFWFSFFSVVVCSASFSQNIYLRAPSWQGHFPPIVVFDAGMSESKHFVTIGSKKNLCRSEWEGSKVIRDCIAIKKQYYHPHRSMRCFFLLAWLLKTYMYICFIRKWHQAVFVPLLSGLFHLT